MRRWAWAGPLLRQPRRLGLITIAAATITVNWGVYIWAVNAGHVVEASLGYFINPLVTIAMGVLLLKERLRPAQWAAVGIGFAAVLVLTIGYGRPPWISLCLAFSFATYGLVKKKVNLGGLESLAAETAIQFLPALGYLLWLSSRGDATFGGEGAGHAALLAATGVVTAVPLVCFGAAAIRVPLSTLGLLQYLAPVLQFLLGILYFHEAMPAERWAGFALVWAALSLLTWDALRTARKSRTGVAGGGHRCHRRRGSGPGGGGREPDHHQRHRHQHEHVVGDRRRAVGDRRRQGALSSAVSGVSSPCPCRGTVPRSRSPRRVRRGSAAAWPSRCPP